MLSEALRLLRVFHDLKQNELAEKLQLSKSYISEIEKGNRKPSLDVIEKYSNEFGIPVSSIMFFSENIEEANKGKWSAASAKRGIAKKVISLLQLIEENTGADEKEN